MNTATSIDSQIEALEAQKVALEEQARIEKRAEEKAARNAQRIADNKAYQLRQVEKATALADADTNNILSFDTKLDEETGVEVPKVTFLLNNKSQDVDIEEHLVFSTGRSYGGPKNKGMKFRLTGGYNDFAKRFYITPKSLLKKVAEHQEIANNIAKQANIESNRHKVALSLLTSMYPDADVSQSVEWTQSYGGSRGWEKTIFVVKGQHGTVNFRQSVKDGDTVVVVDKLIPATEYVEIMADQLLLG